MSCENFIITFLKDEKKLRKQFRSNPSKVLLQKNKKLRFQVLKKNFFSQFFFSVRKLHGLLDGF